MGKPKVLVVDDQREIVSATCMLLSNAGYETHAAYGGEEAIKVCRSVDPDIILLDQIMPPGIDGIETCRQLKEITSAYIIFLTSRADEIDKVVGLSIGADDYLTKPYSPNELLARMKAMLRRPRSPLESQTNVRRFGDLSVDILKRSAVYGGKELDLTKIEFDLLAILTSRPGQVFSRQQLLEAVWGENWFGDDHVVDVHVSNLRKKLRSASGSNEMIATSRGVGFKFAES